MELKIEYLGVEELKPYENNARKHGGVDIEAIKKSIEEFGFNDPIGIWKDNIIIEGHGRLLAAKELKMDKVPVIRLDELTDEQRRAYTLAHNKTAELSSWDFEKLEAELENIDIDMSDFGFSDDTFSIDDIDVSDGYNSEDDDREHFEKTFVFPIEHKEKIISYLKKNQNELQAEIVRKALND